MHKVFSGILTRAVRRGRIPAAERASALYAWLRPDEETAWIESGERLINLGSPAEAEWVFGLALRKHPNSVALQAWMADALYRQSKYEESRAAWQHVREMEPDTPVPYEGLAWVALKQGRWENVRSLADEALVRLGDKPKSADLFGLATLLMSVPGERTRAIELAKRSADADQPDPRAGTLLYALLEKEDPAGAKRYLEQSLARFKSPHPEEFLAWVRERLAPTVDDSRFGRPGTPPG